PYPTRVASPSDVIAANRGSPHLTVDTLPDAPPGTEVCTDPNVRRVQISWVPPTSQSELLAALDELGEKPDAFQAECGQFAPDVSAAPPLAKRIRELRATTAHLRDLLTVSEQQLEIAYSDAHDTVKSADQVIRFVAARDRKAAQRWPAVTTYGAEHATLTLSGRERATRAREEEKKAKEREAAKANAPDAAPAKEGAEGAAKEG
ncbi:MAG: hypothetical protein R3A52_29110, partial [Polyangiales bacterium]